MKIGALKKFDGTVKGYPAFKEDFFELVFSQRQHYLPKLHALDFMIPEDLRKELFSDLGNRLWITFPA